MADGAYTKFGYRTGNDNNVETQLSRNKRIYLTMNLHSVIIGVDPGKHGAIAVYYPHNQKVVVENFLGDDDAFEVVSKVHDFCSIERHGVVAYMELVGGFIKGSPASGSSMFNFGNNFGFWRGLFRMAKIPLHLVRPQKWQAGFSLGKTKGMERKRALKDAASRIYPNLKCTLANADALLILDYARREEASK